MYNSMTKKKTPARYYSQKNNNVEQSALRQRALKEILTNIRNGAMISPAIFAIEQLYKPNTMKEEKE